MLKPQKLPSGSWRVQTCINGKRTSYTAPTKEELMELVYGKKQLKPRKKPLKFRDALNAYIDSCRAQGCSPSTIASYVSASRTAFPQLLNKDIHALTVSDIQTQLNTTAKTHAAKTVKNHFCLISAVCKIYAPSLDLKLIKLNRRKPPQRKLFTTEYINDILQAIAQETADFRIYIILILFTGLRPSEIYALRWQNISAQPKNINGSLFGEISVESASVRDEFGIYTDKPPKTDAGYRTQLITWDVFHIIYTLKQRTSPNDRILKMKPNSVTKRWISLRKKQLVPNIRLYDLRKMYATSLVYSGASEEELSMRLGHSTSAFSHSVYVQIYAEHNAAINTNLAQFTHNTLKNATTPNQSATSRKVQVPSTALIERRR